MNIKDELCTTFCGTLTVHQVPAGFAIGTGYEGISGDPIGFYVVGPDLQGQFTIEDNGLYVPLIERYGADLTNKTRYEAFHSLMEDYGVSFDEDSGELKTVPLSESEIAPVALRFLAFLLRVQDLILMSVERAASTFKEDAIRTIRELSQNEVSIVEGYVIHQKLSEYPADIALLGPNNIPVAVFFGVSESKIYEALLLQSYAEQNRIKCSVVAVLETDKSVSKKVFQRAANHLDTVPIFRGDERNACGRVLREAGINILH
ncbi:DUF1828 domain-containing protein [Nevskia soli]|uniref:DUF1828 domain-containing protein n=1 Tax=Nevskia soli TaxID=418856 RepID=UPI0009FDFFA5|nr:DUF1828 domain-containing protein [Nevskia soli]